MLTKLGVTNTKINLSLYIEIILTKLSELCSKVAITNSTNVQPHRATNLEKKYYCHAPMGCPDSYKKVTVFNHFTF